VTDTGPYPRVLVVDSTPFCRHVNNGIVKSNLFQGWPRQALAQIVYANVQPGFDVCEAYWALTKTSILLGAAGLARDESLRGAGGVAGTIFDPAEAHVFEARPRIERMLSRLSGAIRVPLGEMILRLPSVQSRRLADWIGRFAPEVVFTMGGFTPILRLAAMIAQSRGVPLIPYFTDDWVTCIYPSGPFHSLLHRSFVRWFGRCLDLSTVRMTSSSAMSREYERRYGGRFETFANPIEPFETREEPERPVIRLCFMGSLSPNRWQPLRAIGMALERLRKRGLLGELVIYSLPEDLRRFGRHFAGCEAIVTGGTVAPGEVRRFQLDANILVHVESFDADSRLLTRYSLSTKIPQYLMAERCVLAVGPAEAASIRYISDSGAGLAVSTDDPSVLCAELERLLTNSLLRRAYGVRGRQTAVARHDAAASREQFRALVAEVHSEHVGRAVACGN
jgi:glycosyltransferase involved in cell wall biosynthesis